MPRISVTLVLVLVNVLAYVWEVTSGTDFNSNRSLLEHGALLGVLVTEYGQWWRVITGGFLHGGIAHIAFNMFALFQLGTFVENLLGPGRMLAIYAISLVGGGYAVAYFAPHDVTVGASGAIFGLFGAVLAVGVRRGKAGRGLIAQTLPILAINLAFTFAIPFISKAGHLGGLASGFAAGLIFFAMRGSVAAEASVVDNETGVETEAEYLPPPAASHPPHS